MSNLLRRAARASFRHGMRGGSRDWLTVGAAAWLLSEWRRRAQQPARVVHTEVLEPGQAIHIEVFEPGS
jgi:hypothetical protein